MLKIILPIVVGGVIGYFTNYIAIKMLFRPRCEVYIGKWRVPFTPGVIPKNQKRIANAVGNAVNDQLLTKDDLAKHMSDSNVKQQIVSAIADSIFQIKMNLQESTTIEHLSGRISNVMIEEINKADLEPIIREIGNQSLQEYLRNPMIAMFLNESMLSKVYARIDESIKAYMNENGKKLIDAFLEKKMQNITVVSAGELFDEIGIARDAITEKIGKAFDEFLLEKGSELLTVIDIKGIVTKKIEEMKVEDLEKLVMYVMENELKAIVNLGAVIGALIGTINIFI